MITLVLASHVCHATWVVSSQPDLDAPAATECLLLADSTASQSGMVGLLFAVVALYICVHAVGTLLAFITQMIAQLVAALIKLVLLSGLALTLAAVGLVLIGWSTFTGAS